MIDILGLKLTILGTLLICTFLFGIIPLKFSNSISEDGDRSSESRKKARKWKKIISLLSCYAGGVFLATCLLDLLPQVRSKLNSGLRLAGWGTEFPVGEFVMTLGLFLILTAEQLALTIRERKRSSYTRLTSRSTDTPQGDDENLLGHASYQDGDTMNRWAQAIEEDEDEEDDVPLIGQINDESKYSSMMRSLFLLLSLSVHSVFEGLAIGLQTERRQVLQIFAALVIHKSIIAFSLGLNLVQNSVSSKGVIRGSVLFACTSPIGIAVGVLITRFSVQGYTSQLVDGVLEGLACGTFIYVVFFEILPHEFRDIENRRSAPRLLKLLTTVLGHLTIVAIVYYSG